MVVEDVEAQSCNHRVAQRAFQIELRWGILLALEPGAPFVHRQGDALVGIIFVHDSRMTADQLVGQVGPRQRRSPFGRAEADIASLVAPVIAGEGIEVQR